jgi:hypothetical protein
MELKRRQPKSVAFSNTEEEMLQVPVQVCSGTSETIPVLVFKKIHNLQKKTLFCTIHAEIVFIETAVHTLITLYQLVSRVYKFWFPQSGSKSSLFWSQNR